MLPHALWNSVGVPLLRATFHNWYGTRRLILRLFGADVHPTARVRPSARITQPWNLSLGREATVGDRAFIDSTHKVTIGEFATLSQDSLLVTHDPAPGAPRAGPISVGHDAWIGADAYVGPGVTVGPGAILGAKATTLADLDAWTIYGGDPVRRLKARTPFPGLAPAPAATPQNLAPERPANPPASP